MLRKIFVAFVLTYSLLAVYITVDRIHTLPAERTESPLYRSSLEASIKGMETGKASDQIDASTSEKGRNIQACGVGRTAFCRMIENQI